MTRPPRPSRRTAGMLPVSPRRHALGPAPTVSGAAGRDELDDLLVVHRPRVDLGDHLAQVQDRDVVGDREDVVEVVADQDDREPLLGEAAHQLEDLLGLGHAQRRGRLVQDDQLGVPQHGAGDGHGLPLPTGQARDDLPYRLDRAHGQAREGLDRALLHGGLVQHARVWVSSRPRYMLWTMSRLSHSARSWYTTSMPRSLAWRGLVTVTGCPSNVYVPESKAWMPAMPLISVLLPAPLSPTSAVTWPG